MHKFKELPKTKTKTKRRTRIWNNKKRNQERLTPISTRDKTFGHTIASYIYT